ncbi:MAG: fumarylacetoacetate hydrolase family protein [Pirellulales bacterium]
MIPPFFLRQLLSTSRRALMPAEKHRQGTRLPGRETLLAQSPAKRSTRVTICLLLLVVAGSSSLAVSAENRVTRFVRFRSGDTIAYGILEGETIRQISGDLFGQWKPTGATHRLADVKLLVPTRPSKVLALAGNYRSHLADKPAPAHPEIFFKVPSCLIADGESVVLPEGADPVHYEGELVIVIGRRAKHVPVDGALDYVFGVTCGMDISARKWQKNDVQWARAKASDTFGPCGPVIARGLDYGNLHLQLRQNGEVKQDQRTSSMVHGIAETVSWASRFFTLEPGDLIYTGTPGTTEAIHPGDRLEVELEGVGVLHSRVVAATAASQ